MKRFALRVTLFMLPLAALLALPLVSFVKGKEHVTVESMVRRAVTQARPFRFGPAYSNPTEAYKLRMTLALRPEVLVLGTSRVLQIREAFFRPEARAYNAGLAVRRLAHFGAFLREVPAGREPRVLVAGMDHWFFNGGWDDLKAPGAPLYRASRTPLQVFFSRWPSIYRDYYDGKFRLAQLVDHPAGPHDVEPVGIQAFTKRQGFRRDGSWDFADLRAHGAEVDDGYEQGYRKTMDDIANGADRFAHGRHVSPRALEELASWLAAARDRGIRVVGYLPPFPGRVYEAIRARPDEFGYVPALGAAVGDVFAAHGHDFMDLSDLHALGGSDRETIDGYHESEKGALRVVVALASRSAALRRYCDLPGLETMLRRAARDDYVVGESRR